MLLNILQGTEKPLEQRLIWAQGQQCWGWEPEPQWEQSPRAAPGSGPAPGCSPLLMKLFPRTSLRLALSFPFLLHLTLWIIEVFHFLHLPFLLCPRSVLPLWNLFHLPTSVSPSLITALSSYLCLLWLTVARAKFITCLMSYKSTNMVLFSCFVSSLVLSTRCPLLSIQITPKIQIKS